MRTFAAFLAGGAVVTLAQVLLYPERALWRLLPPLAILLVFVVYNRRVTRARTAARQWSDGDLRRHALADSIAGGLFFATIGFSMLYEGGDGLVKNLVSYSLGGALFGVLSWGQHRRDLEVARSAEIDAQKDVFD